MKASSHPVLPNVESRLAVLPGGRSSQGHYLPGRPAAHIDSAQRQPPDTPRVLSTREALADTELARQETGAEAHARTARDANETAVKPSGPPGRSHAASPFRRFTR